MASAVATTSAVAADSRSPAALRACVNSLARVTLLLALWPSTAAAAAEDETWQVVGRQGLLQVVIVPRDKATQAAAYRAQIAKLCPADRTCFINFFTNSSGATAALPLPDTIAAEATARFRRSTKNGVELLQWSCRLGFPGGDCF
jgi:hypothetical protein